MLASFFEVDVCSRTKRESKLNPVGKRRTERGAGGRAGGTECTGSPVTAVLARPVRERRPKHAHWPRARKPALDDNSEEERQGRRQSSPRGMQVQRKGVRFGLRRTRQTLASA